MLGKRSVLFVAFAALITFAFAIEGELDSGGMYNSVGMMYGSNTFGSFQALNCSSDIKAAYNGCTGSLVDSDDLIEKLGLDESYKSTFFRRLVVIAGHCTRPSIRGEFVYPFDDPNVPSFMSFTYDNWNSSARISYGTITELLGYAPCTAPRNNRSTAMLDEYSPLLYSYKTLAVANLNDKYGLTAQGVDYAFFLLDRPVPSTVAPDHQLMRIAINFDSARSSVRIGQSIQIAGFGTVTYGSPDAYELLGKPGASAILGDRLRKIARFQVRSVNGGLFSVSAVRARGDNNTLCSGDSGSPASIVDNQGRYLLLGIVTHGDTQCRATFQINRLDVPSFARWAKEALDAYARPGGSLDDSQRVRIDTFSSNLSTRESDGTSQAESQQSVATVSHSTTWIDPNILIIVFGIPTVGMLIAILIIMTQCKTTKSKKY